MSHQHTSEEKDVWH